MDTVSCVDEIDISDYTMDSKMGDTTSANRPEGVNKDMYLINILESPAVQFAWKQNLHCVYFIFVSADIVQKKC